jgi:hypothetical protein
MVLDLASIKYLTSSKLNNPCCRLSFGIAAILMGGAMSMSRRQPYRKGWLDGECYLVKDGTYIGSAILVLVTIGSTLGSAILSKRMSQADKGKKVHAQVA